MNQKKISFPVVSSLIYISLVCASSNFLQVLHVRIFLFVSYIYCEFIVFGNGNDRALL